MLDAGKLEADLSDLPSRYIILITGSGKEYQEAKLRVLDNLCNEKRINGIYVSQKTPVKKILSVFKKKGIKSDRIFFIDATGEDYKETKRIGRYLYLSPQQVSDMAIAIEGWVRVLPVGDKFLFLDDYSALFIYNSLGSVKAFGDFLRNRMRLWGLRYVFISVERRYDLKVLDRIYNICDKIIEVQSIGK
ncbi:MAG: hypothetical protein B6U72_01220 [Candidatus Altiarchaeales archaeon ex4484_2]|nr:MAG: hypothetical protein B6U72_01220 [Candidatus Altiarchaeales archaeon ex4484_2]